MADEQIKLITLQEALVLQHNMDTTGKIRNKAADIVNVYAEVSEAQESLKRKQSDLENLNIELNNLIGKENIHGQHSGSLHQL